MKTKILTSATVAKMDQDAIDSYYRQLASEYNTIVETMTTLNPNGWVAFEYPSKLICRKELLSQAITIAGERLCDFEGDDDDDE